MTGCPGFKESNRLAYSPSPHATFRAAGKTTKACFAPAPSPTLTFRALHQALLGLVGLRMEHDDRQKQSSAPPCSAVFYTMRAWKGCYETYNRLSDRSSPWVNKISVDERLRIFILFVDDNVSAERKRSQTQCGINFTCIMCCMRLTLL